VFQDPLEAEGSVQVEESELEAASFSVIDDQNMREIFVQEASGNLMKIATQLSAGDLYIAEDDVISISIHTLLGNARTLGLTDIADAYEKAEHLCIAKQDSAEAVTAGERRALSSLTDATARCVDNMQDQSPYFIRDAEEWHALSAELQARLHDAKPSFASVIDEDDDSEVLELSDDDLIDIEIEDGQSIEFDDDLELDDKLLLEGLSLSEMSINDIGEEPQLEQEPQLRNQ